MDPFLVLLVFSFTSISTVFHKVFHENFEVIFSGKIGQNLVIVAPDPPQILKFFWAIKNQQFAIENFIFCEKSD